MDILEWVHQWDQYEMFMYVRNEASEQGIYMQVTEKTMQDGAEVWDILYDRRIADIPEVEGEVGTEAWEEKVLRHHLNANPQLVNEEKAYMKQFLSERS